MDSKSTLDQSEYYPDLYLKITYLRVIVENKGSGTCYICTHYHPDIDKLNHMQVEYFPLPKHFTKDDFKINNLVDLSNPKLVPFKKNTQYLFDAGYIFDSNCTYTAVYHVREAQLVR